MKKIVIATKNQGKLREMREAFSHLPVEVLSLEDFEAFPEPVEDGATFEANALLKASYYMKQTGCACVADDSGLEVAALGGAPGVFSARYAGQHGDDEANNVKVVALLAAQGLAASAADYRCVLAYCDTDGTEVRAEGRCDGFFGSPPRGENGFGYDPYFYVRDERYAGRTMAQLTLEEKDGISHRGQALRKLVFKLQQLIGADK